MKLNNAYVALGILLLVGLGGFGWSSFQAGADEPRPPVVDRTVPPPIDSADDALIATPNFIVEGVPPRTARLIAEAAEQHRKQQALNWIGKELPKWSKPCRIKVKIDAGGTGSAATTFNFLEDRIEQSMQIEGPLDRILADLLPHEVIHTMLASYFRKPIPRWADEGIALMAESPEEQQRHERIFLEAIANAKMIQLSRLLAEKEYPQNIKVFYSQSIALARYLVQQKDRPTLLAFVKDGMAKDWNTAVKTHYGFADVAALEEAWLLSNLKRVPVEPPFPLVDDAKPVAVGKAPLTALAEISKDGQFIRVTQPVVTTETVTSYTTRQVNGIKYRAPVTIWRETTKTRTVVHRIAVVKAFTLDGKPIDAKNLAERITKETAVLLVYGEDKVDPFYLQVIKPETIILAVPVPITPASPTP